MTPLIRCPLCQAVAFPGGVVVAHRLHAGGVENVYLCGDCRRTYPSQAFILRGATTPLPTPTEAASLMAVFRTSPPASTPTQLSLF